MNHLFPLDIEYVVNERVDIIFEPEIFVSIVADKIGKCKVKDILPLVGYIKADLKCKQQSFHGVNKGIYYSEIKTEIQKLIQCN